MARGIQIDFLLAGLRDSSGQPLSSGKVYTYASGTTTAQATYQDAAKTVLQTNPIILDSYGKATAFGDATYKFVIKDSLDNTISTIDNLYYIVSENTIKYAGISTGGANTFNLTVTPSITSYSDGDWFRFIAHQSNTGSSTTSVSGLSSKTIKKGSALSNLSSGDIASNGLIDLIYDQTNDCMRLVSAAAGVWSVGQGGTGASDAATARSNLSAAKTGANVDITSIAASTSDGTDNASLVFSGGGGFTNSRGGKVQLYGCEHASEPGRAYLVGDSGSVRLYTVGAYDVEFWTNSTLRAFLNIDGHFYPNVTGTQDLGSISAAKYWRDVYAGRFLPTTRQDYTVTNKTTQRSLDCNAAFDSTQWANVLDVLGNVIDDLIAVGIFQ